MAVLISLLIAVPILAKDKKAHNVVYVGPNQVIQGNLFKAGNMVEIAGTVNGDLFVAGNVVNVTGRVEGDVFAAGSMVKINADIGGNIRTVGSNVEISGKVARNIMAAGGNVSIDKDAQVGWGASLAGGNVEIRGKMNRTAEVGAGNLLVAGEIIGDLKAKIGDDQEEGRLTLYPTTIIHGNLDYTSKDGAIISNSRSTPKTNQSAFLQHIADHTTGILSN